MSSHSMTPPPGAQSINQILSEARSHLQRLTPKLLHDELQESSSAWGPTHVVDIRPAKQRGNEQLSLAELNGVHFPDQSSTDKSDKIPSHNIHIIERNVLEWRMDPQNDARMKEVIDQFGYQTRVVVVCDEGYTSSLAARELQRLGLANATDLDGGYQAWKKFLEMKEV
jgi:rhodanese-related sulfurtransferase